MKYFYLLALILFPAFAFSQFNYKEGYIVKTNKDTVKGYIDYREWSNNPNNINFKLKKNDETPVNYTPAQLLAFVIQGYESFISYEGKISKGSTRMPDLSTGVDTTTSYQKVFLRLIASGSNVSLYQFTDVIKERFFIKESLNEPVELRYYRYYAGDEKQVKRSDIYKGQLLSLANRFVPENQSIIETITSDDYQVDNLIEIVNIINNHTPSKTAVKKAADGRFFAGLGANYTSSRFNGNSEGTNTSKVIMPNISLGYDFFNNKNVQRFVFRGELSLNYSNPKLHTVDLNSILDDQIDYSYSQFTVAFTPQVLFNFYNADNFKIYIGTGVGFNLSTYADKKLLINNSPSSYLTPYEMQSFWFNLPIETGVFINKKVEVSAKYYFPYNNSNLSTFSVNNKQYNLSLHYLFK